VNAKSLKKGIAFLAALLFSISVVTQGAAALGAIAVADLPGEAQNTLMLITQGGPYANAKDGVVFGNYEGVLPKHKRGYYHEFTVRTSGVRNRGSRRIIVGGNLNSSRERYYTDDHYASFKRVQE
jgi:ribonuclease T1